MMRRMSSLVFSLILAVGVICCPLDVRAEDSEPNEDPPVEMAEEEDSTETEGFAEENEELSELPEEDRTAEMGNETAGDDSGESENTEDMSAEDVVLGSSTDTTPPELVSVELDKTSIVPGESIQVTVHAADSDSEINYVACEFANENYQYLYANLENGYWDENSQYVNYPSGEFRGSISADTNKWLGGDFVLYSVSLSDSAGNGRYYYHESSNPEEQIPDAYRSLTFTLSNPNADTDPPELVSVELDKTNIQAGESLQVIVHATDTQSGVNNINAQFCNADGTVLSASVTGSYWDEGTQTTVDYPSGEYRGTIETDQWSNGEYYLQSLTLGDNVYNYRNYFAYPADESEAFPDPYKNITFYVDNPNADHEPPVLVSIELDKASVNVDETIQVIARAEDTGSGIRGVYVNFVNESGKNLYAELYNQYWDENSQTNIKYQDGTFGGVIDPDEWAEGEYVLTDADLYDNANNHIAYSNRPYDSDGRESFPDNCSGVSFVVNNPNADNDPPVINGITLSKNQLTSPSDTIDIYVDVTDSKSGFQNGYIVFQSLAYNSVMHADIDENGHGTIRKDDYQNWNDGEYTFDNLQLSDYAGNFVVYDNYRNSNSSAASMLKELKITVSGCSPAGTWKKTDGKWWYQYSNGSYPRSSVELINGTRYVFDREGYLAKGWMYLPGGTIYANSDGTLATSKWIDGEYYVKSDGKKAVSEWVDSGRYYVDRDGKWVRNAKKGDALEIVPANQMASSNIAIGNTKTLQYTLLPADGPQTVENIVWESSDPTVVKVDQEGNITALSTGYVIITGTLPSGSQGSWTVFARVKVNSIDFKDNAQFRYSDESIGYDKGGASRYVEFDPIESAGNRIIVTSSDQKVFRVYNGDNIEPAGVGKCVLTFTVEDDPDLSISHEFEVYKSVPAEKVTITGIPETIYAGYQYPALKAEYQPVDSRVITEWNSDNQEVLEILPSYRSYGSVSFNPKKAGQAVVTASSAYDPNVNASTTIKVVDGTPPSGTYDTWFTYENFDENTLMPITPMKTAEDTITLETGASYNLMIHYGSNECIPYVGSYEEHQKKRNEFFRQMTQLTPTTQINWGATSNPKYLLGTVWNVTFKTSKAGVWTYRDNDKTLTIIVRGEPHWESNSTGWWYVRSDGSYPKNEFEMINGQMYYFDGSGYMATGWKQVNGTWYYFTSSGSMTKGWKQIDNTWYYFDEEGKMLTGLQTIGKVDYYFASSGAMQTGWQKISGEYYFFQSSGVMKKNAWEGDYYLLEDGKMATSQWVDGNKYYVDKNGKWHKAHWESNSKGWWYVNEDTTYPTDEFKVIDGTTYYFKPDGYMATGWQRIGDDWYYFTSSGAMQTGWQQISNVWYYFDAEGKMLKGRKTIGNSEYYFASSGAMQTGWVEIDKNYYYFQSSGAMKKNSWQGDYYLKADGSMAVDERVDNGKYYVDINGKWVPGK